jgi:hypothetical protein
MAREFQRVWGWTSGDFADIEAANATADSYTTADIWTNLTSPDPPINCVDNGTDINCSYIGMLYDDYLLDQGSPCNCTGNVCNSNSPACCATSNCSSCVEITANTNLTDLGAVPSCCATNTCLWESNDATLPVSVTSSAILAQPTRPLTGPCTCNEDGCSDDSPVCCDNGTCPS